MQLLASTFSYAGIKVIQTKPRPTRSRSTYNLGRSKKLEKSWSTYPLASLETNSFEKLLILLKENFFVIFDLG